MRTILLSLTLLAGCFYTDQINQRPGIDIVQTTSDEIYRGSSVKLRVDGFDPEDQLIFYQWRVYACTDATEEAGGHPGCDAEPFDTEVTNGRSEADILPDWTFTVPPLRADMTVPPQVLRVVLEAQDDFGAIARPHQELQLLVSNHVPFLDPRVMPRYGYVTGTPIDLSAKVGDLDDGAASTQLAWRVYTPPNQPSYDLVDIDIPDDEAPTYLQFGKRFTPKGAGLWHVQVSATDPLGAVHEETLDITVGADSAPCLAQWAPITAPVGSALPLTEPTLFRINVVNDFLDPFPTVPGDALLGTTSFAWSIKQPGSASRDDLAVTSNQAALNPANYQPGDIVELRVEIQDRNATPVNCTDASPTCSVISDNACIQRLTWRVEVR